MKRAGLLVWMMLMLSACRSEGLTLALAYQSSQCGNLAPGVALLHSQAELDSVFKPSGASMPAINFASQMAVLVAMGMKPNSAYGLELKDASGQVVDDVLIVPVEQRGPMPDMMYAQVMTSPCLILTLARVDTITSARLP